MGSARLVTAAVQFMQRYQGAGTLSSSTETEDNPLSMLAAMQEVIDG